MPYFATSQEWLRQSALLLEARPTSTRITTTYNIAKPQTRKTQDGEAAPAAAAAAADPPKPRGSLVLKTYDPVSGATLKYRTTKAAEVSRLVLSLGRLGNRMAGVELPPEDEAAADVVMGEADEGAAIAATTTTTTTTTAGKETKTQQQQQAAPQQQQQQQQQQGGGGAKGKKKKGKK